jgi:hypothetical protein
MSLEMSHPQTHASGMRRFSRVASLAMLTLAAAFLLGQQIPLAWTLSHQPFEFGCFFLVVLGLLIAWRYPLQGGGVIVVASVGLVFATHGSTLGPIAVLLGVALLDVLTGWQERGTTPDA